MTAGSKPVDWTNTLFLIFAHLMGLAGVAWAVGFPSGWTLALAGLWLALSGVSITGGYHRLFAHPTYRCRAALRLFYLLFGAAAVQNSALKWSADHRRHHNFTDEEGDPYNIRLGFWWAHMGWVFVKEKPTDYSNVRDLEADPLVRFQHRRYVPLAMIVGWLAPMLIGLAWGDPVGAFLVAGFTRLIAQYHATFSVNSFAHFLGRQPYSDADSSRDSFVTAMITMGEGYHNFHHRFPLDYRNGVRAWQFDPTKWWVRTLSWIRMTWDLRRAPEPLIVRARLQMDEQRLSAKVPSASAARIAAARGRMEEMAEAMQRLKARYAEMKATAGRAAREELAKIRAEIRRIRDDFREAYRAWCAWLRRPELVAAAA